MIGKLCAAGLALTLAACATKAANEQLNLFSGEETDPAVIDAKFQAEVTSRFGDETVPADVRRYLIGQNFQCEDPPPVEARGDYLMTRCVLSKPHDLCSDQWAVELRYARQDRATPRGSFHRTCVSGASPNG